MHLSFDTADLTDLDRQVLALLAGVTFALPETAPPVVEVGGQGAPETLATAVVAAVEEPETKPAPAKKAPAKKAAAKKADEVKGSPENDSEAPIAETEPTVDDLFANTETTLDDAVSVATRLVNEGRTGDVKAALAKVDATRVKEIAPERLAEFVKSLVA